MDFLAEWDNRITLDSRVMLLDTFLGRYRGANSKIDYYRLYNDFGETGAGTLLIQRLLRCLETYLKSKKQQGQKDPPAHLARPTNVSVLLKVLIVFMEVRERDFVEDVVSGGCMDIALTILKSMPSTRQEELVFTLKLLFRVAARRPDVIHSKLIAQCLRLVAESPFQPYTALVANLLEVLRERLDPEVLGPLLLSPHVHVKALGVRLANYQFRIGAAKRKLIEASWVRGPTLIPQLLRLLVCASGREQYDTATLVCFLAELVPQLSFPVLDALVCPLLLCGDILSSADGQVPHGITPFDRLPDVQQQESTDQSATQTPYLVAQFIVDNLLPGLSTSPWLVEAALETRLPEILLHQVLIEASDVLPPEVHQDRMHEQGTHRVIFDTNLSHISHEATTQLSALSSGNHRILSGVALLEGLAASSSTMRASIMKLLNIHGAIEDDSSPVIDAVLKILSEGDLGTEGSTGYGILMDTSQSCSYSVRIRALTERLAAAVAADTPPTLVSARATKLRDGGENRSQTHTSNTTRAPSTPSTFRPSRAGGRRSPSKSPRQSPRMIKTLKQPYFHATKSGGGDPHGDLEETLTLDLDGLDDRPGDTPFNPWDDSLVQETARTLLDNASLSSPRPPSPARAAKAVSPRAKLSPAAARWLSRSPSPSKVRSPGGGPHLLAGSSPRSPGRGGGGDGASSSTGEVDGMTNLPSPDRADYLQDASVNILEEMERRAGQIETMSMLHHVMSMAPTLAWAAIEDTIRAFDKICDVKRTTPEEKETKSQLAKE